MADVVQQYKEVITAAHNVFAPATLAPLAESLQEIDNHINQQLLQRNRTLALKNELNGHAGAYIVRAKRLQAEMYNSSRLWTIRKKYKAKLLLKAIQHLEQQQTQILDEFLQSNSPRNCLTADGAVAEKVIDKWFQYLDVQTTSDSTSVQTALNYRRYARINWLAPHKAKIPTATSKLFKHWQQSYTEAANSGKSKPKSHIPF